jgi:hypothetical protein
LARPRPGTPRLEDNLLFILRKFNYFTVWF